MGIYIDSEENGATNHAGEEKKGIIHRYDQEIYPMILT